jgi:hypothetical protein
MIRRLNRTTEPQSGSQTQKFGWRVSEFAAAVGLSRAHIYNLMGEGRLDSVKLGKARIITTSPGAFLESLRAA